jgi:O-antigen/teichoic acid export membrane protein/Ser/Thr protein kinase RdoA (MazF antagonist)
VATTGLTPGRGAPDDVVPAGPGAERQPALSRLKEHIRDPLSRSSYSLVLGSAITSALGMGFWVLAARLYSARDVGTASALIAAMGFLGSASTIGLKNGFVRFLPVVGDAAPRFIRNAYLGCIAVAAVAATVFLIGQPFWAGELSMLRTGLLPALFFVTATAAWTIFVLQDSVLTGLRMASWVPAENTVFAVSKIALLIALVSFPEWGIFVAWSIPAIALLLPINLLIRRRLLSRPATGDDSPGIALPDIVRFAAGDHVAAFLWLGTTELLALVVLAQAGAESAAFYFLSFQIAYSLYLLTSNVSSAFVVEAAIHSDQETQLTRKALFQAARLVVPGALIAVVAAPWLLRIIGSEYEANGVPLLRLLLLSAIPQILVGLAVGRARLHRHVRIVIAVYALTAISLFIGSTVGLRAGGLEAVGWTWLVTQLVLATILTPTVLHPPIGRWMLARTIGLASSTRTAIHQGGRSMNARRVVPAALEAAGAEEPTRYTLLPSHHDAIVARSTVHGEPVVVRIAMTPAGEAALADNAEMLERLGGHRLLPRWQAVVPSLVHRGRLGDRSYVVESFLPGAPLDRLEGSDRAAGLDRARSSLGSMHHATSRRARFDDSVAHRWIDEPIEALGRIPAVSERRDDLARLRSWLRSELVGRRIKLCWVHGDFWAGNVLVNRSGDATRVTGIIDWENGRLDGLADVDLAHLWLAEQPGELGTALGEALERPETLPGTTGDDDGTVVVAASGLPARAVLVLAWLAHVSAGVARSTDHPPGRIWMKRNVLAVLDRTAELTSAAPAPDATHSSPDTEPARVSRWRERIPRPSSSDMVSTLVVLAAALSWVVGFWGADPREMTEIGLVSLITPPALVSLALLTGGFVVALRRNAPGWVLALHVVVLIVLLHGTPAVLYGTLRYSWAWKHTGIVEFITRTGSVDTTVEVTPIYHSWPGFFAVSALLTELVGARHAARLAMWAPVAFNLFNLLAVRALFRSLTSNRRMLWLALWLFFITNWVGQDYFAPQAFAYLLYIAVIAIALRGFRRNVPSPPVLAPPIPRAGALAALVLILGVTASSHQITPFLAMVVLAGLVLFRQIHGWYLPVVGGALMGIWAFTVGNGELTKNTQSLVDSFGRPISNAEETLEKAAGTAPAQQIVSQAGRLVVVALAVLAVVGLFRLWRRKQIDPSVLVIAATPAALPFATEFGGEAIFRVFLFAVPAMALLGAAAIEPVLRRSPTDADRDVPWSTARTAVVALLSASLLTGFTVAYYGKDQQYYFTEEEIAAMAWVAENSEEGSLLVEGSRNYPSQFVRYEYFTYVAIAREPTDSWERVLADPVGRLSGWLDNDEYTDTYLMITRSQKIDVDLSGPMPEGSIDAIEQALRDSERFRIAYENRDAVVFALAGEQSP